MYIAQALPLFVWLRWAHLFLVLLQVALGAFVLPVGHAEDYCESYKNNEFEPGEPVSGVRSSEHSGMREYPYGARMLMVAAA